MILRSLLVVAAAFFLVLPCRAAAPTEKDLLAMIQVLRPLHRRQGAARPGDWLSVHHEGGQTFRQYLGCDPVLPTAERRKIYVQPIGAFTPGQRRVLDLVTEGMGIFLDLPVVTLPTRPASAIPHRAQRLNPGMGDKQFLTTYILYDLLKPSLPSDAAACIGLTATDLWPGGDWNFVFGQASVQDRVGVWSIAMLGDPETGPKAFRLCLWRALGTAVHETCHMFTMLHCTAYPCVMAGRNSLEEGDRLPLWLCPECLAKLCFAVQADPIARYRRLEAYCHRNGLAVEATFYRRAADLLEASWPESTPTEP